MEEFELLFLMSGTDYANLMPHELAKHALSGILKKLVFLKTSSNMLYMELSSKKLKHQTCKEASLAAGYNEKTPSHTVTMACISSKRSYDYRCWTNKQWNL
ncbi:hypothetical protein NQ317_003226 [Molorchus minor]|uniref:Uncharacterized protein n=1 Tax=Molorchus minor TaxID=1323400 RepID=A0ABQ9JG56_9CUCU|nr:hypothetical protein NQ317_003226 [Molorchus minor]